MWKPSAFVSGIMVLCNAIWQQFHSQQLQRMACVAASVVRQKVVQPTVCTQPMNCYHSGSPVQAPTKTNHHCDGVPCQHPRKFRTAESLGTKLIPSWRLSNHGRLTFGVGKRYSNSICRRLDLNSSFKRAGVSNMWADKLFVRGISNSLMADSVAANSLLLRTVSINAHSFVTQDKLIETSTLSHKTSRLSSSNSHS